MSQILDALKELDRKNPLYRGRETNVSGKFRTFGHLRRKKRNHVYLFALLLTPLPAAAITYAIIARPAFLARSSIPVIVSAPASTQKDTPPPLSPEPANGSRDELREITGKSQNRSGIKTSATPPGKRRESPRVYPKGPSEGEGLAPKAKERTSAGPASILPPLKISAIVWDEDASKRRAVINGIFNIEGSTIEGIKVFEIKPTSVRFSHQGRFFEISALE
jgi:hypothetical protein